MVLDILILGLLVADVCFHLYVISFEKEDKKPEKPQEITKEKVNRDDLEKVFSFNPYKVNNGDDYE